MTQWSAITSREVHNSRREWLDKDGRFRASVKLMCDWGDRFKLIQDLYTSIGTSTPGGNPTVGYQPRAYPGGDATATGGNASPDLTNIGVTSASIGTWTEVYAPRDANNEVMDYKSSCFVDVQYGRRWNIEETIEYDVEVFTQSHKDFLWATELNENDSRIVKDLEVPIGTNRFAILSREFIGLATEETTGAANLTPDIKTLHDCVGHTNDVDYSSTQLNMTFKKGTLLMIEPEIRPSIDMQSRDSTNSNNFSKTGYAVTVKFLFKKGAEQGQAAVDTSIDTHNLFWRPAMHKAGFPSKGGWDKLKVKVSGEDEEDYPDYEPFTPKSEIKEHWLYDATLPFPVS